MSHHSSGATPVMLSLELECGPARWSGPSAIMCLTRHSAAPASDTHQAPVSRSRPLSKSTKDGECRTKCAASDRLRQQALPRVPLSKSARSGSFRRKITSDLPVAYIPTASYAGLGQEHDEQTAGYGKELRQLNVGNWVGSRPAAFAEMPPNSGQAVFHQNADLPLPQDRQVVAPSPSRQVLADRHDLDLDRIRDLLPVLVAGPSRQPIPSG